MTLPTASGSVAPPRSSALRAELGGDAPLRRTRGRGEADPVAPTYRPNRGDKPHGRALNRRVDVAFPC